MSTSPLPPLFLHRAPADRIPFPSTCRGIRRQAVTLALLALAALITLPAESRAVISVVNTGTTGATTYSLAGTAYVQSFDSLPSSGSVAWSNDTTLPGWSASLSSASGALNATIVVADGSGNLADLRLASLGASASAERALALHTRLADAPTYLGVGFANDSGRTLTAFSLAYAAEQWKESNSARNLSFAVEYRIGATAADLNATAGWTAIAGLNFTSLNGTAPSSTSLSATAVAVTVPAGSSIWFRWITANTATSSTSSNDIIAIDDVSVSFSAAPLEGAPVITTQPASQSVLIGTDVTLTVVATSETPLTYQWKKDGADLPGATAATLAFPAAQVADAGAYTVVVTNDVGSALSDAATLTVTDNSTPPSIVTSPQSQSAYTGDAVTFTVAVTGPEPFTYQWRKDDADLTDAMSATLTLAAVTAADAGSYTVVVTNAAGSATSEAATLTVTDRPAVAPVITLQPESHARAAGFSTTFTIVATGTAPLTYQWAKDGAEIPGATSAGLTLADLKAADAGSYTVTVSNSAGSATSSAGTLAIVPSLSYSVFNLTGFAVLGTPTTGGGVIAESDPAYRKVYTPLDFAQAVQAANKTGSVKVIEIMNDLDLGWNEIGADVQTMASTPFTAAAPAQLHPVLLTSGVSNLIISPKGGGLTIFSANGATVRHVTFSVKNTTNVIIRNLKFDELWEWDELSKGDYDKNNWDFIDLGVGGGTVDHVWIDHCTFTKSYDGIVDTKGGTSNVTYSWNRYAGDDGAINARSFVRQQLAVLEANKSNYAMYNFLRTHGYSVEDIVQILQGPDKTQAIGELSLAAVNVNASVTFHHQWYHNTWDRLPRLAGGTVHNYNIYVDDVGVLAARRLRDTRFNAMSATDQATFLANYNFKPPINGSICTENGAMLIEKSVYVDCLWPLRNNQTDPSNPIYTGKIMATDTVYVFHQTNGTTTTVRGNSTDAGSPLGPFQAPIIPFSWNTSDGSAPYTLPSSAYTDPDDLPSMVQAGAGAGALTWSKDNWLRITYAGSTNVVPEVTTQPKSQAVALDAPLTLSVAVQGTMPFTYQWKKDGSNIGGATSGTLSLSGVQLADAGAYTVVVSNIAGSTESAAATITVGALPPAPVVDTPTDVGSNGFTARWAGVADAIGYRLDVSSDSAFGSFLAGYADRDMGSVLSAVISGLPTATTYYYRVRAVNVFGAGESSAVMTATTTAGSLTITAQPVSQAIETGLDATFTVAATSPTTINYQWKKGATDLADAVGLVAGASTATLTLSGVQAADAGDYSVVLTNAEGFVVSDVATLAVGDAPLAPAAFPGSANTVGGFSASWSAANGATGYRLDVATDEAFANLVPGYANRDVGAARTLAITGLVDDTIYYYRVKAYNIFATGAPSNTIAVVAGTNHPASLVSPVLHEQFAATVANTGLATDANGFLVPTAVRAVWYAGAASLSYTADTSVSVAAGSRGLLAYVAPSTAALTLDIGEMITTRVTFRFTGGTGAGTAGNFRLGLLYSNGNGGATNDGASANPRPSGEVPPPARISTDNFSLTSGGNTPRGYSGYIVDTTADATAPAADSVSFWRRDGGPGRSQQWAGPTSGDLAANSTFTQIGGAGGGAVGAIVNDGTAYVGTLSLYRLSASRVVLIANVTSGGETVMSSSAVDDGTSPLVAFDTLFLLSTYDASLAVTDVTVTKTMIPPVVVTSPASRTVSPGGSATFQVVAAGSAPFSYQWRKDGAPLADDGRISGATSSTLTVSGLTAADAGSYSVTVSNAVDSITSAAATLAVQASFAGYRGQYFDSTELGDDTISGPLADPDADGVPNLVEYAAGLSPQANEADGLPTLGTDSGRLTCTYIRRNDAPDLVYTVEVSDDLATWHSGTAYTEQIASTALDATRDRITVRDLTPLASGARRFIRLHVALDSPAVSAATPPLGAVNVAVAPGQRLTGMPLVNPAVARDRIASHEGTTLTLAHVTDVGALLASDVSYFVEVTGGAPSYVGERFEIDVAATKTAANHTVALVAASSRSTLAVPPDDSPALVGGTVVIRPHVTIAQLFGAKGTTLMQGSTISAKADQVQFLDPQTQRFEVYYLLRNSTGTIEQWTKIGGGTVRQDATPIPSGTGVVLLRRGPALLTLTWLGEVRLNAFAQPLVAGSNLVSQPFPVDGSPADRAMTHANGFAGSTIVTAADEIQVYAGNAFQVYYLLRNPTGTIEQWTKVGGDTTDYSQSALIDADGAVVVRKIAADPLYYVPVPAVLQ